jgi:hypothetical protein
VGALVTRLTTDVTRILRAELALIQVRLTAIGRAVRVSGVRLAVGAALGLIGVGALTAGLVLLLATRMPPWSAAFAVGAVLLLVAGVLTTLEIRTVSTVAHEALMSADEVADSGGSHGE